jgi:hypothetical protein
MATSSKVRNDSVLPQRTRVRVQREIINLLKNAPEGTKLIVDPETGLPPSLSEIVVSYKLYQECFGDDCDGDAGGDGDAAL